MSSQQKRGFRLRWAAERSTEDGAAAATLEAESADPTTPADIEDEEGGDLGERPTQFADAATPEASTDASPEAPEVPETTAEAAMIDTETATNEAAEAATSGTDHDAWPAHDQRQTTAATTDPAAAPESGDEAPSAPKATARPSTKVEGDAHATRSNPLVAGLVKAMREAALASRDETTTRVQGEATKRVEAIREAGTSQAAELRKTADDDIAGIREWSKSEIARVKQETDDRIDRRRTQLAGQTERHEANVERLVEQVQGTVAAFESDMDSFFEQLLAENDPARLAALAEHAPEPPDLTAELIVIGAEAEASAENEWGDQAWGARQPAEPVAALEADAAAEAEAAATEGLEIPRDTWPTSVLAAARRTKHEPAEDFEAAGVANTSLFVTGLTSVAGISAFKGALGQLSGVRSVSVSSGEPGVFIFTVVHAPETDLQDGIAGLTSFSARVTDASEDHLTVVAQEPAA